MSADKYPLPSYACSVWVAGDHLMVAFPGTLSEQGHTIKLPVSEAGLKTALSILKERAQARDLRLSHSGTPSQHESEALLAAISQALSRKDTTLAKQRATAAEAREASEFLKELGL